MQPRDLASRSKLVVGGFGITSATTTPDRSESKAIFKFALTSGNKPIEVAFMTISTSFGIEYIEFQVTSSALVPVLVLIRSTTSWPRFGSRLTIIIFAAPASASSAPIARAAPPAPNMTMLLPFGSVTSVSD